MIGRALRRWPGSGRRWSRRVPHATLFRLTVSFDRFRPADAVQLTLPWHAPDDRSRVVRLRGRRRHQQPGRPLIGYGPEPDVGAKIAYGRIPELRIFSKMRLGDADGGWLVATCGTCGRQTRVDPAEVLTHPRRVAELALRLRCRDCAHRADRPRRPPAAAVCRRHDLTRRRGTRMSSSFGWQSGPISRRRASTEALVVFHVDV